MYRVEVAGFVLNGLSMCFSFVGAMMDLSQTQTG